MSAPAVGADDALETLVRQFADPLACLRELVQNGLDAGSRTVDVTSSYAEGVLTFDVQDQGEGMDEAIIDTKLTRLFASSKEGDLTKIGRFGIGFVSVFALEPEAVVVDTGRGGQSWRVLFRKDRSFARIALPDPVAGTRVRLVKALPEAEAQALITRARSVLHYWCKHVEGEITFDGEVVSGPLALEGAFVQVRHQEEGTDILVGIREDFQALAGFYNKGLTLYEGPEGALPGLVFKVSSRHLEHTLTRDNVLHDERFDRAMAQVHRLAEGPLAEALFARLRTGGTRADWKALRLRLASLPEALQGVPIVPAEGGALSVKALVKRRKSPMYWTPVSDALSRACHAEGVGVLLGHAACEVAAALLTAPVRRLREHFVLPTAAEPSELQSFSPLASRLEALLAGWRLAAVVPGHLPESHHQVGLVVPRVDEPTPVEQLDRLDGGFFSRRPTLVVNLDHPAVAAVLPTAAQEPELAAWMVARLVALERGRLDDEQEAALLAPAFAARVRRVEGA